MKKKGFTLIEILGVIVLLGVVVLITVPIVNSTIKNSKENALKQTISVLEDVAYEYSNSNNLGYSNTAKILEIDVLKEAGFIKDEDIINPVTGNELEGCIFYRWDDNYKQYEFNYSEECETKKLDITLTNVDGKFNESGWTNKPFYVKIDTNGSEYKYCVSNKECNPTASVKKSSGSANVTLEGNSVYVCAYAIDGVNTSEIVCSDAYKLDMTKPKPGTLDITGTKGENDWYTSDISIAPIEGADELSGHLSTTVDTTEILEDTVGTKVTVTTKDIAGNEATGEYTLKIDKTEPTISITKEENSTKLISTINPISTESGYTYKWYKDGAEINGAIINTYTPTDSGTYKVVTTTGAGKSATSNEIKVSSYIVSYDMNGGTGNIESQTKLEDITLKLSTTIPTRDGYEFLGWGVTANDKDVDYTPGTSYTSNESIKLYAIWKKTVTITFIENGAILSGTTTATCDMYNADTSCSIKTPTIIRNDFTITGYNTDSNATTSQVGSNASINVSSNTTYYAITKKEVIVTFYRNGATKLTAKDGSEITETYGIQRCIIWNTNTSCSITSPTITASSNTPTVVGYATSASATSSAWEHNTEKTFTANATYYAITKKDVVTYTANFDENGAMVLSLISQSCTINATYNGTKQSTSCTLDAPEIKRAGFTIIGYNTTSSATTSNSAYSSSTGKITLTSSNTGNTWYAITSKEVTVTFYRNGATSLTPKSGSAQTGTSITQKCTIWNNATSCSITSPTITASTNTPTVVGYATSASATSSAWEHNTASNFALNATYYAITRKDAVTHTATFVANGATLTGTTNPQCTIDATYNGTAQSSNCTVKAPTITRTGYVVVGYGTSTSDTEAKVLSGANVNISSNITYVALTKEVKLVLTSTSGTTYPGGSNLTTSIDTTNSKNYGSIKCSSSNNNVATCTVSGTTVTMTPGKTSGSAVITVTENNANVTAKYTFNNENPSFTINATFEPVGANYYASDSIRYWLNESYYVKVNVTSSETITKIEMCTATTDTCDPTGKSLVNNTSGSMEVIQESNNNRVCVQAYDSLGRKSSVQCSEAYGLDTVKPTAGTILVNNATPSTNWYNTDLTITKVDGTDALSGHLSTTIDTTSITSNTSGKTVTVTTKDKAGNTATRTYTLKLDKTAPTVTIAKTSGSTKLTATVTPSTTTSNYTYKWYKGSSVISGATSNTYTPTEAGTYKVVVTTGAGKSATSNTITINSYTVTYNMNGGTSSIANQTKVQDITLKLSTTTPTRSGYTFMGWGTTADDITVDYASGANYTSNSNITLYAIWKKTVTVTFVSNGATLTGSTSVTCDMYNADANCSVKAPTITRNGFDILGYSTSVGTTAQVENSASINVSSNTTYYAITSKKVTVTFYRNGATLLTAKDGTKMAETYGIQICIIWNTNTACSITSPTITASSNTPTVVGYATSASATSSAWNQNTEASFTSNATYYAITRKDSISFTANFNANGAALSSTTSQSCTIATAYNGATQDTSCTVTAPTITRSGFTITGYNTTSSATANNSAYSTSTGKITLTSSNTGSTWYAITSKEVTVTFNRNGAASLTPKSGSASTATSVTEKCTIRNSATSCSITSPTITASSNTPTVVGYATSSGATSSAWTHNTEKAVTANASYYAITRKNAVTYTVTYAKGTGVSAIGATTGSCTIDATYNGTAQSKNCSITLPTITASTGYTVSGWFNSSNAKVGAASASVSISATQTLTAQATINSYTCSAGYYLAANGTSCTKCEAGSYCAGGKYNYSSATQGKTACPSGYTSSAAGSNEAKDCYKTLTLTYNANTGSGTTSSQTCNVYYNNTSCSITLSATGFSKSGYNFLGYYTSTYKDSPMTYYAEKNTDVAGVYGTAAAALYRHYYEYGKTEGRTIAQYKPSSTITLTANTTIYAAWVKEIVITFNRNGASAITPSTTYTGTTDAMKLMCPAFNSATSCSITSPKITPASGYAVVGWNTSSSATASAWTHNTAKTVSSNATYYAITKQTVYADSSGANKPELLTNMIPVKYDGSNWVYADINQKWYDYDAKEWANAVVLNSGVTKSVGDTISESEIALMYVWIPRYTYTIFNANNGSIAEQIINVKFEKGTSSTGTVKCSDALNQTDSNGDPISEICTDATNGSVTNNVSTYTHPAFTFGGKSLKGFWVGKFEVGGSTSQITIKPTINSLVDKSISAFFTAIQNINSVYGVTGDSHMIKNMEWGAVAYLKQSKYGLGTTDIRVNNYRDTNINGAYVYKTGCGYIHTFSNGGNTTTCAPYNNGGEIGSTTGNVYGVYDMSGGAAEYVMGNMAYSSGKFNNYGAGFSTAPDGKYYDTYTYNGSSTGYTTHSRGKLGDATKETLVNYGSPSGGWYGDEACLPYKLDSWLVRGGESDRGNTFAGLFYFMEGAGSAQYENSSRAVLTP